MTTTTRAPANEIRATVVGVRHGTPRGIVLLAALLRPALLHPALQHPALQHPALQHPQPAPLLRREAL